MNRKIFKSLLLILLILKLQKTESYENYCSNEFCTNFWIEMEYLYWKIKNSPAPIPLVYSTPSNAFFSNLGDPGTFILLGGKDIPNDWRSGGRFSLGWNIDRECCLGIQANYFFIPKSSYSQTVSSDGSIDSTSLRIPFFNVITLENSSTGLALPNVFSGTAILNLSNKMQGAEVNVIAKYSDFYCMKVSALVGFRYWNFDENFSFNTNSPFINSFLDVFRTHDQFNTENNFFGGQIGLIFGYDWGRVYLDAKGKFAMGAMLGKVFIDGYLLTNDFSNFMNIQKFSGGYFALPTNIGKHHDRSLSILPEINFNLGYNINENIQLELGYSCIYVNKVLWATQQLDDDVNPSQSPSYTNNINGVLIGTSRPMTLLKTADLWIQGLNVSFKYNF